MKKTIIIFMVVAIALSFVIPAISVVRADDFTAQNESNSAIYDAYNYVLRANSTFINDADKVYESVAETVAIHDITGDGSPELIFLKGSGRYNDILSLYIYTFDGKGVACIYDEELFRQYENYYYSLFLVKDKPGLYSCVGGSPALKCDEYSVLTFSSDNNYEKKELLNWYGRPFSEDGVTVTLVDPHYYLDGKETSADSYSNAEKALLSNRSCVLLSNMSSAKTGSLPYIGMTAEYAKNELQLLASQMSGAPEWEKLYRDVVNNLQTADAQKRNLYDYFSLQDFDFDGVPELYVLHDIGYTHDLGKYTTASFGQTGSIYYIKDGAVHTGEIHADGMIGLFPIGSRIPITVEDTTQAQFIMRNNFTGDLEFITKDLTIYQDERKEYIHTIFNRVSFDKATGFLSVEPIYSYLTDIMERGSENYRRSLPNYELVSVEASYWECLDPIVNTDHYLWAWRSPIELNLSPEIHVSISGTDIKWTDAIPFIDANSRTMVPLRAVGEALGLTVGWDDSTRTASFSKGGRTVFFPINSSIAWTNDGQTISMDTATVIEQNRTYAPVRYLAEYFGYTVGWDAATKTVVLA